MIKSDGDIGSKLYFSKKTIVNEDLEGIDVQDEPVRGVGLEYSLIRGFAAGCTMLFNEELYKKLIEYTPKVMTMHDSWILKVAGVSLKSTHSTALPSVISFPKSIQVILGF